MMPGSDTAANESKQTTATPSATRRRSKNGVLVALAVVAAIGITAILNYVVYWQYRGMSPDSRGWVRYDLTSTRRYSLSPQSRGVLDELDQPHRLVTMLGGDKHSDEQQQRIRDLIDEYARASDQIDTLHIDLDTEPAERNKLLAEMDAMFAEDTAPIRNSIADGLDKLEQLEGYVNTIESSLRSVIDSGVDIRPPSIQNQRLTELHSQYLRLQQEAKDIRRLRNEMLGSDWQTRLESPGDGPTVSDQASRGQSLPDYTQLMAAIQRYVIRLTGQTLPDTPGKAEALRRGINIPALAPAAEQERASQAIDTLVSLRQQVPELIQKLKPLTDPLLSVAPPLRYEDARTVLSDEPCVLLTAGGDARVIRADLLFRGAGGGDAEDETDTGDLFVGEEQLTGALISMTLDPPPLIVFVRSNTGRRAFSALGQDQQRLEGDYDHVAHRLLAMDFELAEWANPQRDDPPVARPGQKTVWITLPYLKPDSRSKESLDHTRKDKVAKHLAERLAAGDSALVMLSYNPDTDPKLETDTPADSLVDLLGGFGIEAQVYQNVSRLQEDAENPADTLYSSEFLVGRWPDSPITGQALDGIDTFFLKPMPLRFDAKPEGVKQFPIVELTVPAMHVQRTVPETEPGTNKPVPGSFTPEPDSERERVMIGAAVTRGEARLATVGEATWAIDNLTSLAILPDGTPGSGLIDKPGARIAYPGNSDLFVNCVCWLAHEEDLIAASPRTRDIRRIGAISPATVKTYRVLLWGGMPAVIFGIGIGVWLMRRRA